MDLSKAEDVLQACGQLQATPGADVWLSLTCTFFSPWQHLNLSLHGPKYKRILEKNRKLSRFMLGRAMQFLEIAHANHGRIAIEWPKSSGLWDLPEWKEFSERLHLRYVLFDGCSFNLRGKGGHLLKKPWCVATTDLRLIQILSQHQYSGNHVHEPTPRGPTQHCLLSTPMNLLRRSCKHGIPKSGFNFCLIFL